MQCHNFVAFFLAVPMAVYYGYSSYITPDFGIKTISDTKYNYPSCTKPLLCKDVQIELKAKLTQIDIPKKSQIEVMKMLDNLDWVDTGPCRSPLNLEHFFANKFELLGILIVNSLSFVIMHALAPHLGIMIEIAYKNASDFQHRVSQSTMWSQIRNYKLQRGVDTVEITPEEEELEEMDEIVDVNMSDPGDWTSMGNETCYYDTYPDVDTTEKVNQFLRESFENMDNHDLVGEDDTFMEQLERIRNVQNLM